MSGEVNMIQTLRNLGGARPSKFGGGQSKDIFRGGPVKKITLYNGQLSVILRDLFLVEIELKMDTASQFQ